MNSLLMISEHGWWIAGWTMVYFLAIGSVAAIVAGTLRFMMRSAAPTLRYAVSLVVFAMLALLPVGIAAWLAQSPAVEAPLAVSPPAAVVPVVDLARETFTPSPTVAQIPSVVPPQPVEATIAAISPFSFVEQSIEQLPWLWLSGTPLTFLLLATGLIGAERLRRSSETVTDGPVQKIGERLRLALGLSRQVAIAVCDRVATPLLVGIVRPLILLPPAALGGWSPDDLEMVLLHELAHVKRWDNLVNLLQRIIESALFFHPAVWLASHWIRVDREDCCDAVVVARTAKPQAYAELLVSLAGAREPLAGLALAHHPLGGRIRRILHLPNEPMRVSRGTLAAVGTAMLALVLAFSSYHPQASTAEDAAESPSEAKLDLDLQLAQQKERMERLKDMEKQCQRRLESIAEQAQKLQAMQAELAKAQMALEHAKAQLEIAQRAQSAKQPNPDLLQPGDVVVLQVKGALPEDPLWSDYRIESMGTIALGPTYGRVEIAGYDLLDAEEEITKHLRKILEKPAVQLTLNWKATRASREKPEIIVSRQVTPGAYLPPTPASAGSERQVLYDGQTFESWKNAWRRDLSIDLRIKAVHAFVAFAGTEYGKEAVDEIMAIVDQYDWSVIGMNQVVEPMQRTCVVVFSEGQIPTELAVDAVIAAADSPSPRVREFLGYVLEPLSRVSKEANETLRKRFPDRNLPKYGERPPAGGFGRGEAGGSF